MRILHKFAYVPVNLNQWNQPVKRKMRYETCQGGKNAWQNPEINPTSYASYAHSHLLKYLCDRFWHEWLKAQLNWKYRKLSPESCWAVAHTQHACTLQATFYTMCTQQWASLTKFLATAIWKASAQNQEKVRELRYQLLKVKNH